MANTPVTETDWAFSDLVSDYWVEFARSGNPNGSGRPDWPVYTLDDDVLLELSEVITPHRGYLKARLDYHRDRAERAAEVAH
jgi:para-nitrobenzyl esterase